MSSALRPHPVTQMLHGRPVQRPDQLELDVVGRQVLEQPSALPEQDGISCSSISSSSPARRHACAVAAPCSRMSRSPAAALAWATQDSMPSVT